VKIGSEKILALVIGLLAAARGMAAPEAIAAPPGHAVMASLTDEERAWIAAHPVVRVGHDPSYAPYSFPDATGRLVGIDLDYAARIAQRTGLRFQNDDEPGLHAGTRVVPDLQPALLLCP